jgi:glutathione S-transferase
MKLYYSPGACALHPQIALREAGIPFDLVRVDLRAHKLGGSGDDFYDINPKGYVPVLELDDGTRLTEGAVIDQFVADKNPGSKILPPAGTLERVRVQEWLHFIGTELHKQFSPLFGQPSDEVKDAQKRKIAARFDFIEKELGDKAYLTGETFTVADGYLFNMLRWTAFTGIDLAKWPKLAEYSKRVEERPAVKAAVEAEKAAS